MQYAVSISSLDNQKIPFSVVYLELSWGLYLCQESRSKKVEEFENTTNASNFEAFSYLLLSLVGVRGQLPNFGIKLMGNFSLHSRSTAYQHAFARRHTATFRKWPTNTTPKP